MTAVTDVLERFWSRVDVGAADDCWPWTAGLDDGGYPLFSPERNGTVRAHRFSYELANGPIPAGFEADHLCHNRDSSCAGGPTCPHRRCVNPAHLEAVTPLVNTHRSNTTAARNLAKTHCPQGHPYDGANTRVDRRSGKRHCRACSNARSREFKAARRAS